MGTIIELLIIILSSSLIGRAAAFIITLAKKWGLVEHVQIHGNDFFAKMFSCDFCLSFWVSLFFAVISCHWHYIPFVVVCSTMISRKNL